MTTGRSEPFEVGAPVVWRSRPRGDVGFVFACRVLVDAPDVIAVVQPTGAPVVHRVGERGGPQGRSLSPGAWDGTRRETTWDRPPAVRLHPIGRSYSVIRTWLAGEQRFHGWYVNLEQPWIRTAIGFDSRDDVLDVTVSDDLAQCRLKDHDELEFAIETGLVSASDADVVRTTAASAMADVTNRRWPFIEPAWHHLRPQDHADALTLPTGWAKG